VSDQEWMAINEQHLALTLRWLRLKLQQLIPPSQIQGDCSQKKTTEETKGGWFKRKDQQKEFKTKRLLPPLPGANELEQLNEEIENLEHNDPPPALLILAERLGLSRFEQHILALCAAVELDTRIANLCAQAQNDASKPNPTFALAFALFDDPDWNALSPHAPLRLWRLLEINQPGAQPLTGAALGADERIVNYLKGLNYLDDRLTPLLDSLTGEPMEEALPPSQQQAVDSIIHSLKSPNTTESGPVIELLGHDVASKRLVARRVTTELGLNLQSIDLKTLPSQTGDFETFTRLWQRESMLLPLALYIEVDSASEAEKNRLKRFLERSNGIVFVQTDDAKADTVRNRLIVEVNKPTPEEQERIWTDILPGPNMGQPQQLAEQFSFSQSEITRLATMTLNQTSENDRSFDEELWQACRVAARAGMTQLAQRIDAKAGWEHLVLPSAQTALLHQITDQVVYRNRVYEDWGFRGQMNRGLGINGLFAGDSGTGKTMAAEVIANELNLDLFRVDISAVVSKYIGETEKNLRKLFDAAEDSGAILFFDEADALFGKRSEVKDSHDRYANIEINYLLQRMESYRGLAILATNMKSALDKAFVRRIRFIVDFPFPDVEQRKQIWQRVFPANTPIDKGLDFTRLARFNLTGGNIHNVALNAAFLAAQQNCPVTMPMLLNATRTEFKKLERPVKESDFRWQGPTGVVL